MSSTSSSPVIPPRTPSSSANVIAVAGKSILKRPPPPPQSLFSRISKFLPTQNNAAPPSDVEAKPLKRAHFILPEIAIVYPISSVNPPSTPTLKEEKRAIEEREIERRRRVLRGGSSSSPIDEESEEWWPMDKVESFYQECCAGCDDDPDPAISAALKHASSSNPRTVDFSGVQLTLPKAYILSDVFSIEWGLRKVVFRECDLDEQTLKPILHSLLIPGTLSFLSVASNRRLKTAAFLLIGAYLKKAKSLQFLDVSQNALDKKSVEYIVATLATAPEQGLVSLRMDDCSLRPASLETLCRAVRTSSLRNISLRHNKISASGGVALALMIRDYPDVVPTPLSPLPSSIGTPSSSAASSPTSSVANLALPSPMTPTAVNSPIPRVGPILPPPRHPGQAPVGLQTTYTPYVPRSRRGRAVPTTATHPLSPSGEHVPIITSSTQGGVTARHPMPGSPLVGDGMPRHDSGPSAALLDKVRALDSLPRLGALRTLDLKGNDLRNGITYLAQVLKRNRTLKLLNLSENKLDVQCLVTIAEALKYNSSLETLDLNKNPCCGPGLEGIQSLRTAFTLNSALKRLFLSSTNMSSAGAIALAEFLPESMSLLHLDLTNNNLDIAGVMALSSGLKANHVMRCLDLNIPPGNEEFAKMCREILSTCTRNTETAERKSKAANGQTAPSGRGAGKGVWNMIEDSELAKSIRLDEGKKSESDIVARAHACIAQLSDVVENPSASLPNGQTATHIVTDSRAVVSELATAIQETDDPLKLEQQLELNDRLLGLLKSAQIVMKPTLTLHGLGLNFDDASVSSLGSGQESIRSSQLNGRNGSSDGSSSLDVPVQEEDEFEESPSTPRVDKGKRRADPVPIRHEKILSPTFLITESESEDESRGGYETPPEIVEGMPSPTDRSRSWVAEEGEVFRKGQVLLGPEELESEYAGEDLRREILETQVERPPPRPITDEFGMEIMPAPIDREDELSPLHSAPSTPVIGDAPKPYTLRTRSSSSSILSVLTPPPGSPKPESPTKS
ncbi:RNI-like protein [Coprinopsis marcescibilis]|uniref:RNI-like protein n=1 Tax=Coprinopsis marcescibilis TaxID=230819 RepID=A0A5C3KG14_COPMA|nr:RNI-like protein [Coprinopsis marcescibilis]